MYNVKVNKTDLLKKVKANRESHRDLFLKAQRGYREEVIKELDKMIEDARKGKLIRRSISLPEPIDHTQDYDRVIAMLEMSIEPEIVIDSAQFDQYVLDNWAWKALATLTNSSYVK
jgi:hypothetical protein